MARKNTLNQSIHYSPDLGDALKKVAELELVDPRVARFRLSWPEIKRALSRGVSHKTLHEILGAPIAGADGEVSLAWFSKQVQIASARGKRKARNEAAPARPVAKPVKPAPAAKAAE